MLIGRFGAPAGSYQCVIDFFEIFGLMGATVLSRSATRVRCWAGSACIAASPLWRFGQAAVGADPATRIWGLRFPLAPAEFVSRWPMEGRWEGSDLERPGKLVSLLKIPLVEVK
jgi:hypothetical protein